MLRATLSLALLASALGALSPWAQSAAPKPDPKEAEVRRLLKLMDTPALARQVLEQVIAQFKQSAPAAPAKFWSEFLKEADVGQLIERMVPIYAEALSLEDLRALSQFFESPVGRRYIKAMPQMTRRAQTVSAAWGTEIAHKIVARLEAAGYK